MDHAFYSQLWTKVRKKSELAKAERTELQEIAERFGNVAQDNLQMGKTVITIKPLGFSEGKYRFVLNVIFEVGASPVLSVPIHFHVYFEGEGVVFGCEATGGWRTIAVATKPDLQDSMFSPVITLIEAPLSTAVEAFVESPLQD